MIDPAKIMEESLIKIKLTGIGPNLRCNHFGSDSIFDSLSINKSKLLNQFLKCRLAFRDHMGVSIINSQIQTKTKQKGKCINKMLKKLNQVF